MGPPADERRWRLAIVHDDAEVAEQLGNLVRGRGFDVAWCWSYEAAEKRIELWPADIVLTAWDRPLGQGVYRWAKSLGDLGRRFAFVVDEIVPRLQRAAEQKRVALLNDLDAVLDVLLTTRRNLRATEVARARAARSRLLLVEDDPDQRAAMIDVLRASGYDVLATDGIRAAVTTLEAPTDIDAILSDWSLADGSGAELHNWIASHRPDLLSSLVFITGGDTTLLRDCVWPAPVLPKGQDSMTLVSILTRAIEGRKPGE